MKNFDDTSTEITDLQDDKLLFLNGKERLKYYDGKRTYARKRNKVGAAVHYLRNLIKK